MVKWRTVTLFALVVLWAIPPAFAGWVIEEKTTHEQSAIYFQSDMIRKESSGHLSIMDLNKGTISIVNSARKVYWSGPISDLQRIRASAMKQAMERANARMAKLREKMKTQMKNPPPDQPQAKTEAMQNQPKGRQDDKAQTSRNAKVEVKRMDDTATIAGQGTRKYQIWVNGTLREEQWIAKGVNVGNEIDVDKLARVMGAFAGSSGMFAYTASPEVMDLWKEGYPLRRIQIARRLRITTEVIKVVQKRLPASTFQVPADYRKVNTMMEVIKP